MSFTVAESKSFNRSELCEWLSATASSITTEKVKRFWNSHQAVPELQQKSLNQVAAKVLETDDKELIALFRRATRNHNALFEEVKTEPVAFYNRHHLPPAFQIPKTHITLNVTSNKVEVTTVLQIERKEPVPCLILDGVDQKVLQVEISGNTLKPETYTVTPNELIIPISPQEHFFEIKINSVVNAYNNRSMEGLYPSNDWLITQCESEGARRIFYTIDRPDVLSTYKTTIIAHADRFPTRISNGNFVQEGISESNLRIVTWEDPFPKPSYLFAVALGDFGKIDDTYTTKSGKEVKLEIYMEKGKEHRAEYAMYALKKSMEFDETFFDLEYDLDYLKLVAVPDFNAGAMENKGLLIFNESALLVDPETGTDHNFMWVALVVMHEYAHNWSGNRVTVRNWFELALKEAFTDFRATLFMEWFFSEELCRVEQIDELREGQFPEDSSPRAHPLIIESYVNPGDIYDGTTYVKGRELFRLMRHILEKKEEGLFRKATKAYFTGFDGQAVTINDLLQTMREVSGLPLVEYERWFKQPGTPTVAFSMEYDEKEKSATIRFKQSCPHPKTGKEQQPFHIPITIELLDPEGVCSTPQISTDLIEREGEITFKGISKKLTPTFMHALPAPVRTEYDYSEEDLKTIILQCSDPFLSREASDLYMKWEISSQKGPSVPFIETMKSALKSPTLSILQKTRLLQLPSMQSEGLEMIQAAGVFKSKLAKHLQEEIQEIYHSIKTHPYTPQSKEFSEQVALREFKHTLLSYLRDPKLALELYESADNFEDRKFALQQLIALDAEKGEKYLQDFHDRYKNDLTVFTHWIKMQAGGSNCTVETLKRIEESKGYSPKNPNHLRSVFSTFASNQLCYHDPKGEGYAYVAGKIIEISRENPHLATNYIACAAFGDYKELPPKQKELMREQLIRIQQTPDIDSGLKSFVNGYLKE